MKNKKTDLDEKGNFIFRWKLDQKKKGRKNPLANFITNILNELLNIISLSYKGKDLKIDGFRFFNDTKIYKIFKTGKSCEEEKE